MCQLSNLIHWLVLHSELTITEHHHHDGLDLFPDFGRQIPFGTGTSISYNYIDYRFRNDTRNTYQLRLWTDDEYLRGELRATEQQSRTFHIHAENEFFRARTVWSIETARSIATSSTAHQVSGSTANSSEPTTPV